MRNLHLNTKLLTFILFIILLLPSCNNEELFVEETLVVTEIPDDTTEEEEEEEEEESPINEDEITPVETVDDTVTTNENVPIEIIVHTNDTYIPTSIILTYSEPSNGVLSINDNETPANETDDFIIYTPNSGFFGIDSFEYTICDLLSPTNCSTSLVTITVNPNIDIPTILKAFPSAYGGGSNTTGGRGGVLVMVNTLNPNEPLTYNSTYNIYTGGAKAAFNDDIGARYITFTISGNIDISGSSISCKRSNITAFGQSAPEGGVTFHGGGYKGADLTNNIILRYLRFRNGTVQGNPYTDDRGTYGIYFGSGDNIIVDHCSASWGGDKAILLGDNHGFSMTGHTVQRCAISDSHTYMQMSSQNAANFNTHRQLSAYNNLFARGGNRTPNIGGTGDYIDVINNIIQSDGNKLGVMQWIDKAKVNWDRNYYQFIGEGRNGWDKNELQLSGGNANDYNPTGKIYNELQLHSRGNYYEKVTSSREIRLNGNENADKNDNSPIWAYRNIAGGSSASDYYQTALPNDYFVENEHNGISNRPPTITAGEAYTSIVRNGNVGACRYMKDDGTVGYYMDSWDIDLIKNVEAGTMQRHGYSDDYIVPTLPTKTRSEDYDSDFDGMSDVWERANFGGNLDQGYNDDFDNDGYTNIEEYYNQVDS